MLTIIIVLYIHHSEVEGIRGLDICFWEVDLLDYSNINYEIGYEAITNFVRGFASCRGRVIENKLHARKALGPLCLVVHRGNKEL